MGALASNNTGLVNTAIGNSTLSANTDGNFNTAVGFGSLQSNTTGSSNSALGYVSLSANISAGQNSAFGNLSLTVNTTGGSNTALGYSALTDNISGSNNIGIGYNSGGTLTTGSNNTFIGANVVSSSSSLANNILIGNGSGAVKAQHDGTNWTFTGGATITGQLSLGSTITNGTYTYTLPSATGTLALVGGVGVGTVTSVSFTLGSSGTDLSSSVTNSTTTPAITLNVPTASASARGALSAADWTTFDNKQIAGNYITSLTGEATASGPGAAAVTLTNSAVIAKVLTGLNVTGGTVIAADTILAAFGKVQNQINGLIGGSIFQGVWNASTNTPALVSSVGTNGYYYIVNVAGSTNLDGITDWKVGDWAIFAGTSWQKVDNTDAVSSVNGFTGAVSLTTDNVPEGATNLYFTNTRARTAISLTTTGSSGASTYDNTTGVFNIPNYIDAFVGTVTSVGLSSATSGVTIGSTPITTSGTITIAIATATASQNGLLSSTDWTTFNSKQDTITLTTTGTSGASTFIGNTLNIPDYGGALTGYLPLAGGTMTGNINWGQTDRGLTWSFNTDGASIKFYNTGDGDTDSRLEFATSDNNDEYFRWGHLPSGGGPFYESMKLLPVSSGNAELIVSGKIIKSGGTSAQFLKADGSVDSTTYQGAITLTTTGTSGPSTLIGNTLNIPDYIGGGVLSLSAIGSTPNANAATITGTVLNLQPADASFGGVLKAVDWVTFNSKQDAITLTTTGTSGAATFIANTLNIPNYAPSAAARNEQTFTATSGQTVFSIAYTVGQLDVYYNGSKLSPAEFTATNGTSFTLATACQLNDIVDAVAYITTAGLGGGGTINTIPKFTASTTIGDSAITDNGTTVTLVSRALAGTSANFTGQLTLGSTITNGTYTYSLPSATGILALTSDIHSAVTLSAIGATANANGATLTGQVLNLQPADASFGGVVTTGTQTFAGAKTLTSALAGTTASFSGSVGIGTSSNINQRLTILDNNDAEGLGVYRNFSSASDAGTYIRLGGLNGSSVPTTGAAILGVLEGSKTAGYLTFLTVSASTLSERMRITPSGNIGIGVTPSAWDNTIFRGLQIGTSNSAFLIGRTDAASNMQLGVNAYFDGTWKYFSTAAASRYYQVNDEHIWDNAVSGSANSAITWAERMRITSGGDVLINCTSVPSSSVSGFVINGASSGNISSSGSSTGAYNHFLFYNGNGLVGYIQTSGYTTTYGTSSDYRLKKDVQPITDALARIQLLNPVKYKWKCDDSDGEGFIAHELQEIIPSSVIGEKDGEEMQGVDYSKIVPILVKAIQEQQAQIEELKALIK